VARFLLAALEATRQAKAPPDATEVLSMLVVILNDRSRDGEKKMGVAHYFVIEVSEVCI
jgi:hypothetical protein